MFLAQVSRRNETKYNFITGNCAVKGQVSLIRAQLETLRVERDTTLLMTTPWFVQCYRRIVIEEVGNSKNKRDTFVRIILEEQLN